MDEQTVGLTGKRVNDGRMNGQMNVYTDGWDKDGIRRAAVVDKMK